MTDKELQRLKRDELLEILLEQQKEIKKLEKALEDAEKKLADRDIKIANAGSIAEASLQLNNVFAAAQAAADQYLKNIHDLKYREDAIIKDAQAKADKIIGDAKIKAHEAEVNAKRRADAYWAEVSTNLDTFYKDRQKLKDTNLK